MSGERQPSLVVLSLLATTLFVACAGTGASRPQGAPRLGGEAGDRSASPEEPPVVSLPVGIESADARTQRTFTFHYDGPRGDGVLSLTLRLQAADRFLLTARDRILRRQVWSLEVAGERGLLIDRRAKTYCWYGGEVELAAVPLGPLPLTTLPALLLGRIPILPGPETRSTEDGRAEFQDSRGRQWRARTVDGEVETWTLYADAEPEVWYSTRGKMRYLSARREELQLRWRENLAEALDVALAPPVPPEGFSLDCP